MYGVLYARPAMGSGRRWDALLTPSILGGGKGSHPNYGYSLLGGSLVPKYIDFLGTNVLNLSSGNNELVLSFEDIMPAAEWTVFSVLGVQYPRSSATYSEASGSRWLWPTSALQLFDDTQSNIPVALW